MVKYDPSIGFASQEVVVILNINHGLIMATMIRIKREPQEKDSSRPKALANNIGDL